jgi:hypothetical protein
MRALAVLVGLVLVAGGLSACGEDGSSGLNVAAIDVPADKVATVTFTAGTKTATFEVRDGLFYPAAGATAESATLLNASDTTFPVLAYRIMDDADLATPDYGLVSIAPAVGRPAGCGAGCGMTVQASDGSVHKLRVGARTFNSAGFYATVEGDPRVFLLISATVAQIISLATGRPFAFPKTAQELELEATQARLAEEAAGRGAPEANYDPYLRQVLAAEQDRKAAQGGKPGGALVRAATSTQDQPGGRGGPGSGGPSAGPQPQGDQPEGTDQ